MKKIAFMVLLAVLMAAGSFPAFAKTEAELISQFNELIPPDKIPEPTIFCTVPAGVVVNPGLLGTWVGTNTRWDTGYAFIIKEVMKEGVKQLWVFFGWDDRPYTAGKGTREQSGNLNDDGTKLNLTSPLGNYRALILDVKGRRLKYVGAADGRGDPIVMWLYPVPIQPAAPTPAAPATAPAK